MMGLLTFAAEIERKFFRLLRRLFGGGGEPHHLEVRQGILDEAESRVQPIGNAERAFPYNRLLVRLKAEGERRYLFESAFVEGSKLKNDILERLRRTGCKMPPHVEVEISFAAAPDAPWARKGFHVEYRREGGAGRRPRARFTVKKGRAEESVFVMTKTNLNVGRMQDVKDRRDLVVRRNDLVFVESAEDEVNKSVSRAHAHVWYDDGEGFFRLCDDNSAQGTFIFRDGRTLEVPRNSTRGVRLRDGDEIYFGRAVVIFEIVWDAEAESVNGPT